MKNWFKSDTPWVWLNAGALSLSIVMVVGLLGLIAVNGFAHFWASPVIETNWSEPGGKVQRVLGEVADEEVLTAAAAKSAGIPVAEDKKFVRRYLFKQGNRDIAGRDFVWYLESRLDPEWKTPDNVIMLERREWGNFYGYPVELLEAGQSVAQGEAVWTELLERLERSNDLFARIREIERDDIGDINYRQEQLRLEERRVELNNALSDQEKRELKAEIEAKRKPLTEQYDALRAELAELDKKVSRDVLVAEVMDGNQVKIPLKNIVRATQPNAMSLFDKIGYYIERFVEFITDEPREANTEGGIFPAIFGTVTMVLLMTVFVTPFGILAALYLREYAKQGPILRIIRISVYNLAGVPSIVFGVFGVGFFVYFLGGNIDQLFFPEALPAPTFGTPGLFWVSLTLALLTLPVVIVATEEGLARIPRTLREGSFALGATKAETLWKVVVPLATPAMMTGMILAVARAAGEVAPLMLVGVVKLAPSLPVDSYAPFVHLERKIMHLGFHIYDVGFQSPNVEAARPLVYATALILVMLILVLNLTAIGIRNHLREKYKSAND
ncbi:phosphate ABC transporter permease PstA [Thiohalophilus sp.]|uniref:phosphate ABC transporter permease PstA n=1 Tax=Thiohalophilus sp. TaxID=3028392 RepID=UPI002ACE2457|nr:phosphate ABC transporter permease PstA [Thiohalophilus sp.]MDZ7663626.1 phosphate ABC transporter permease PstA [Thiohalophilus sp.]